MSFKDELLVLHQFRARADAYIGVIVIACAIIRGFSGLLAVARVKALFGIAAAWLHAHQSEPSCQECRALTSSMYVMVVEMIT